ncbi:SAM-dependent methyltransferase [Nonomuraea sp. NN258]|uniref:O-methyltransferase n=1 Tax=Nonomuraea antri TaxID=2730852 RepID=UPI00156A4227|nr:O-methyltransferase [Nonomuraea antri]NRQ33077.1 SAM-dependent methyltransferase [Nonomuraea antri]
MSPKTFTLSNELHAYVVAHGSEPDDVAKRLTAETRERFPDDAGMMISPEQARFLTLMTKVCGAGHAVEVGTFTGYSALAIARGLPQDGRLTCFDTSAEYTGVARRFWAEGGVLGRIELRVGRAEERLRELPAEPGIDLAFIDADKTGYPTYWEEIVVRTRPGGLIFVDNALRGGRVLSPGDSADVRAVVEFNAMAREDDRVEIVLLPIGDGLLMARRL